MTSYTKASLGWKKTMLATREVQRALCEKQGQESLERAIAMLPPVKILEYGHNKIEVPLKGLYIKASDEDTKG